MKILLSAIYPYVYLLLFVTIPFEDYVRALPNILLGILVIVFPFIVKKDDFKKIDQSLILILLFFFGYLLVNAALSGTLGEDFSIIKKVLIAVGLVLLYIPVNDFNKIKKAIIFSSVAAIIFSVVNIVILTNTLNDFHFGDSPMIIEALLVDRLYLGMLSVLSILVSYSLMRPKFHPKNRYYLANMIINILFLFLIGTKIALLLLVFLLLLRQLYGTKKRVRIPILVLFIAILGTLFYVGFTHKDDKEPSILTSLVTNTMTWELRSETWECGWKTAKKEGVNLTGIGFYNTKDRLVSCYENIIDSEKKQDFTNKRYNTHNQFLDFYVSTGLIGFLLFSILITALFIKKRKKYFPIALLLSLVAYCMVENVFHRQIGAYYIGFILIVLVSNKMVAQNNTINEG
ncbi:O-antigen ligase family protein [Marixanthomonas ophiurae]|uniref:O-antigen ligase family protein n=1 Tax=Marixanthomonas ophiurae TaxID=387659 RepID=A0A3E1QAJ1_9FLAO|nr:O-antigen ligase family protein [Marixanthomonas ophiurae]RFN59155.1 O-antigen ligase family protein [Marixanthomonas ophiurae]